MSYHKTFFKGDQKFLRRGIHSVFGPQITGKHVCFHCRVGNKNGGKCTHCGELMHYVGRVCPVPKKRDKRGWKALKNGEYISNKGKKVVPSNLFPKTKP